MGKTEKLPSFVLGDFFFKSHYQTFFWCFVCFGRYVRVCYVFFFFFKCLHFDGITLKMHMKWNVCLCAYLMSLVRFLFEFGWPDCERINSIFFLFICQASFSTYRWILESFFIYFFFSWFTHFFPYQSNILRFWWVNVCVRLCVCYYEYVKTFQCWR